MRSPTGRLPSEPEMQDLRSREGQAVVVITPGMDFADIEMRVFAAISDPTVKTILLDIEADRERGIELPGRYDYTAMIERHNIRAKEARTKPQPSYLQHDRTKNVARRGRK